MNKKEIIKEIETYNKNIYTTYNLRIINNIKDFSKDTTLINLNFNNLNLSVDNKRINFTNKKNNINIIYKDIKEIFYIKNRLYITIKNNLILKIEYKIK